MNGTRNRATWIIASVISVALLRVHPAHGDNGPANLPTPIEPRRYELAGFPIIGGNTDIGVQFGGAATWTHFYDQASPYDWNIDLLVSASMKDVDGLQLVQQSHLIRLDAPDLLGGRARLDTRANFQRTINAGYYGLGNASDATTPPAGGSPECGGRAFQYLQEEGRVRSIGRLHTNIPGFDVAASVNLRIESPQTYCGSKLQQDTATTRGGTAATVGTQTALLGGLTVGVMIDTRDSEFITRSGIFYQLGLSATIGSAERVAYTEVSAVLAHYASLGGPFLFASRFVTSFQVGRLPFYDLQQGGTFEPQYLLGGETGVRGVPQGRYAGPVKMLSNLEIRSTPFPRFMLLGERFLVGTTTFFDAGRVWDQYSATSSVDGSTLGLKFGIGGGLFLQWGEAAIFRVEAAYSPDAVAENPKLPIGLYVSDGVMF